MSTTTVPQLHFFNTGGIGASMRIDWSDPGNRLKRYRLGSSQSLA